jgi:hypothetical protein
VASVAEQNTEPRFAFARSVEEPSNRPLAKNAQFQGRQTLFLCRLDKNLWELLYLFSRARINPSERSLIWDWEVAILLPPSVAYRFCRHEVKRGAQEIERLQIDVLHGTWLEYVRSHSRSRMANSSEVDLF